jgi:pimeloyl-ACP methyl ester carboxylesterase
MADTIARIDQSYAAFLKSILCGQARHSGSGSVRRLSLMVALGAAWLAGFPAIVAAQDKGLAGFGIVLMHGKGGQPGGFIDSMAAALRAEGALVVMPKMAWSGAKGLPESYGQTYEQALSQIDHAIEQLKSQGAAKIVVGGHSLGANAAIGFAARRGAGLAGVVALAPGHTPERMKRPDVVESVGKARQLVAAGRGSDVDTFADLNQGRTFGVKGTAAAYLSFFDPAGPAAIPRNAAGMPAVPLLWVIGRSDPLIQLGRDYAFTKGAKHAKSRYVEVDAGHEDTPHVARADVIAWLKSL